MLEENPPCSPFYKGGNPSAATPETQRKVLPFEKGETEGIYYHIAAAERLITETGYRRRDAELAELQDFDYLTAEDIQACLAYAADREFHQRT